MPDKKADGRKGHSGGAGRGQGLKPTKIDSFAPDQVITALRERLDTKPPAMINQVLGRQALALIDAQRRALEQLISAARHALRDVVDEDAAVLLEGRIEEAEQVLWEYRPDDGAIIL